MFQARGTWHQPFPGPDYLPAVSCPQQLPPEGLGVRREPFKVDPVRVPPTPRPAEVARSWRGTLWVPAPTSCPHPGVPDPGVPDRGCAFKGCCLEAFDNSSFQRDLTSKLIFQELWLFSPQIEKGLTQLTDYRNRSIKVIFLLKGKAAPPQRAWLGGVALLLVQDRTDHP